MSEYDVDDLPDPRYLEEVDCAMQSLIGTVRELTEALDELNGKLPRTSDIEELTERLGQLAEAAHAA